MKRIKIPEQHEVNKVLRPSKLSSLIKRLQKLGEVLGNVDPDIAFTDEHSDLGHCTITLNMQWTTHRKETDEELKERIFRVAEQARIEATHGESQEILEKIREKGAAEAPERPDSPAPPSARAPAKLKIEYLESRLIQLNKYDEAGVPAEVKELVMKESANGVPTGVGHDATTGWFIIQNEAGVRKLVWQEKE